MRAWYRSDGLCRNGCRWSWPLSSSFSGGRRSKDPVEELFELGAAEASGFVATDFPPLEGVEIDAPFSGGF
jgi:hypothetical protein